MIPATASPKGSTSNAPGCPTSGVTCDVSYNWAGYAVYKSTYRFTKISGDWTVPTITGASGTTCPDAQTTWDSNSVWIGLDGFNTGTVEQTGTSSDCFYGTAQYYAWYEFYPSGSVLAFPVKAGDAIKATVTYTGTTAGVPQFKTTVTDTTSTATKTSPTTGVTGALRESAEWIDESPYYNGFLGLTQVGQIKFTSATAVNNSVTGSISHWGSTNVYWLLSIDFNYVLTGASLSWAKAEPAATTSSGKDFTVAWISEGP
ncbi:MAG: G1 family endopeptidase [Thermoplasmata archaeon]|nr:G1 family endopeptidase [Thermoplasmata archaeon]